MLSFAQCVIIDYRTLLMKNMAHDGHTNDKAKANFKLLCNVQILLGLATILSPLQAIHNLIMFNQLRDVFVYDFVATTKICQGEIFDTIHRLQNDV
jgi:hypothetical protein